MGCCPGNGISAFVVFMLFGHRTLLRGIALFFLWTSGAVAGTDILMGSLFFVLFFPCSKRPIKENERNLE